MVEKVTRHVEISVKVGVNVVISWYSKKAEEINQVKLIVIFSASA